MCYEAVTFTTSCVFFVMLSSEANKEAYNKEIIEIKSDFEVSYFEKFVILFVRLTNLITSYS